MAEDVVSLSDACNIFKDPFQVAEEVVEEAEVADAAVEEAVEAEVAEEVMLRAVEADMLEHRASDGVQCPSQLHPLATPAQFPHWLLIRVVDIPVVEAAVEDTWEELAVAEVVIRKEAVESTQEVLQPPVPLLPKSTRPPRQDQSGMDRNLQQIKSSDLRKNRVPHNKSSTSCSAVVRFQEQTRLSWSRRNWNRSRIQLHMLKRQRILWMLSWERRSQHRNKLRRRIRRTRRTRMEEISRLEEQRQRRPTRSATARRSRSSCFR